jgi:hypothetical protein
MSVVTVATDQVGVSASDLPSSSIRLYQHRAATDLQLAS